MKAYKSTSISWYIRLNILLLGFLAVILLMKHIGSTQFQSGLKSLFFSSVGNNTKEELNRSAKIKKSLD